MQKEVATSKSFDLRLSELEINPIAFSSNTNLETYKTKEESSPPEKAVTVPLWFLNQFSSNVNFQI